MITLFPVHFADEGINHGKIGAFAEVVGGCPKILLPFRLCLLHSDEPPLGEGDHLPGAVDRAVFRHIFGDIDESFRRSSDRALDLGRLLWEESAAELFPGISGKAAGVHQAVHNIVSKGRQVNVHHGLNIGRRSVPDADPRIASGGHVDSRIVVPVAWLVAGFKSGQPLLK